MAFKVISVALTGDATSLRAALLTSAREVERFGDKVEGVSGMGAKLAAGFAVAGAAVAAGLAVAVKGAVDFETAMRNVNSISGLSEAAFRAQGEAVLDLSRQLPQSAQTLAEGLYEIASSGFQGAEGLHVLEESAKAASAGLTTTNNSAKAITAVLNAYGRGAQEAADVSDVLFQTVNLGVVSFEELTGVIGDTVGTAAAAGVGIEEVGAAIATMTLAGISGAEAGTSLNQVFQKIIKPSDELATVLRHLGYESGASALETDGLRGVMMKLQEATGGNIESMLALFPEIRAARGALALLANEGENYARVSDQITDANKRQGATQRALDEQMKALSAQFKLFVNGAQAGAIELGTRLLPVLGDTLTALQTLGRDAMPHVQAGLAALAPFFAAVVQVGGDLLDIARQLVDNLGPLAKAVAGIVAVGIIAALNGFATALSGLTGLLAEHETVVTAAGLAYAGFFAATKISAGLAALPALLGAVEVGAAKAALGVGNLAATLTTLKGAAGALGIVAAVVALTGAVTNFSSATSAAKRSRDELLARADTSSLESMRSTLSDITDEIMAANAKTDVGFFEQTFKAALDILPFVDTGFTKAVNKSMELEKAWKQLATQSRNFSQNAESVAKQTGLSTKAVEDLAKALEVDLTKGFDASGPARQKIIAYYDELVRKTHGSGESAKAASKLSIEALEAQAAAAQELAKKVSEAFSGATDIVKGFSADVAKEKGLKTFLAENLKVAQTFADDIQTAAKRGLDPAIITKLLQAGPEAAAPFLQAIAADHSGNLIKLANETEKALGAINTKVVAFARLTQQAINSTDDRKITQLGDAMRITAEVFETDGARTAEAISTKLQIPLERVKEVAKEYGITLGGTTAPAGEARAAAEAFGTALAGLAPKLVENGRSLDVSTTAGKANRDAIQKVIDKAYAHVDALDRQGATMDQKRAAFNRHIEDLRATLTQAGYTKQEIDALIGSLKDIEGTYRAKVEIDSSAANATLDQLQARLNRLNAEIVQSGPGGGRGAERAAVEERIDEGGGYVSQEEANSADGNIFRFYGAGGFERHVAQVAKANTVRVWAEPETGGEAYIPLSPSKRGRSTDILSSVASEFGYGLVRLGAESYDAGGFNPRTSTRSSTAATVTAGGSSIDYDRLGRAIAAPLAKVLAAKPQPVIKVNSKVLGEVVSEAQHKSRRP